MISPVANQQMEDILAKYPDLDAFTPTGGFPQFLPDAYAKTAEKYKDKIASGALALVVADTLPVQIELMKKGLSSGQVGQRPFEMGYKAMYFLKDIKDGKPAPSRPDLYRPRRLHAEDRRHLRWRRQLSLTTQQRTGGRPRAGPFLFAPVAALSAFKAKLSATIARPLPYVPYG